MSAEDPKTAQQRNAAHLWFERYAKALNAAGIDQRALLELCVFRVPNTKYSIKEVFRGLGTQMYGIDSTEQLTRGQIMELQKVFESVVAEGTSILVEWPRHEDLESFKQYREAREA